MKRPLTIQKEFDQIGTIKDLTSVFEAISSLHIAQIKGKVLSSTAFFNELWQVYALLRGPGGESGMVRQSTTDRPALVVITSEGGLIGDIDERIVGSMLQLEAQVYAQADIFVVGGHGATLLAQRGIKPVKVFRLPDLEKGDNVRTIAGLCGRYGRATVYYQTYVSLTRQEVARIELFSAVQQLGQGSQASPELISTQNYIIEPSVKEIIHFMESVMLEVALGQVVLESKLAQYASRFNAMYAANSKAEELRGELGLTLHRARRAAADERIKEILSAMKTVRK